MKKLSLALCVFFLSFLISPGVFAQNSDLGLHDKQILILQSYQRDYYHTRAIEEGIEAVFSESGKNVRIRYEFMDTKNYLDADSYASMAEIMTKKYQAVTLDGLILCDDDALQFYNNYGKTIWPDTTDVVSTGINDPARDALGIPGVVIIEKRPDAQKNIELALMQNASKNIQTLHFIYDNTTASNNMRTDITELLLSQYPEYQSQQHYEETPDELKALIDGSGEEDLFFFVLYSRDRNNLTYQFDDVPRYTVGNAKNPVYALYEFYLGTGVVGGYMVSSRSYGENAASTMLDLWDGKTVPPIIHETGANMQYIFDYDVLKAYNVTELPQGAKVINQPISYFEENKTLIIIFSSVIGVLILIIGLLLYTFREKNAGYHKTLEIVTLNQEIMDTQRDLITKLGAVIETRSHETANHVKRVAKISEFLAREYGLSEQDVMLLTAVSPMHDVGKIGIAESILHKPGKLSEQEYEIIKYHTDIGYEILRNPDKEILSCASFVALEHHEKWGGGGYPSGKSGENIHVFARITAIADVYDALRSVRVYKESWTPEEASSYILSERGKFFEPKLVDIFMANLKRIEVIRYATFEKELTGFNNLYQSLKEKMDKIDKPENPL